jgi:hypothetical protein
MTASLIARLMVSAIAGGQGIVPLFVDLNRTHATNPLWTGHARFHLVYQVFTLLPVGAIAVGLLWWPGADLAARFYLAALLTATSLAGFLLAMLSRGLYGGALRDPNGIRPVRIRAGTHTMEVDMNAPIVVAASVLLIGAVVLYRFCP